MPAVVRGVRRASVEPRAKRPPGPGKPKRAVNAAQGGSKLHAARGVGLSPVIGLIGTAAIVVVGLTIALATGDRAAKLSAAAGAAVDSRFASLERIYTFSRALVMLLSAGLLAAFLRRTRSRRLPVKAVNKFDIVNDADNAHIDR